MYARGSEGHSHARDGRLAVILGYLASGAITSGVKHQAPTASPLAAHMRWEKSFLPRTFGGSPESFRRQVSVTGPIRPAPLVVTARFWRGHHYGPWPQGLTRGLSCVVPEHRRSLGNPICRHTRPVLIQQRPETDPRADTYPYSLCEYLWTSPNPSSLDGTIHDDDHVVGCSQRFGGGRARRGKAGRKPGHFPLPRRRQAKKPYTIGVLGPRR
jgi:hypothetical protein